MKNVIKIKLEDLGKVQKLIRSVYESKQFVIGNGKCGQPAKNKIGGDLMYCRLCKNIRQDRYGGIYCSKSGGDSVRLNQICHNDKFELDNIVKELCNQ